MRNPVSALWDFAVSTTRARPKAVRSALCTVLLAAAVCPRVNNKAWTVMCVAVLVLLFLVQPPPPAPDFQYYTGILDAHIASWNAKLQLRHRAVAGWRQGVADLKHRRAMNAVAREHWSSKTAWDAFGHWAFRPGGAGAQRAAKRWGEAVGDPKDPPAC